MKINDRPGSVATIGFFDGVHLGHKCLIDQVANEAKQRGLGTTLITFAEHPARVLRPDTPLQLLTTPEEKAELLGQTGIGHISFLSFNRELADMSARAFMDRILRQRLQVRALVIGYDHRFGHNRSEGFEDYQRYGREMGMEVIRAGELDRLPALAERSISSSYIRECLTRGDIERANACLGYRYFIRGMVVGGFQVGRSIGYPTANILPTSPDKLIPRHGAYAVEVEMEDGAIAYGMLNIGTRPTLGNGENVTIEVNLFDFHADLYAELIEVRFVHFLREEKKFPDVDSLKLQLQTDEQTCRALFSAT